MQYKCSHIRLSKSRLYCRHQSAASWLLGRSHWFLESVSKPSVSECEQKSWTLEAQVQQRHMFCSDSCDGEEHQERLIRLRSSRANQRPAVRRFIHWCTRTGDLPWSIAGKNILSSGREICKRATLDCGFIIQIIIHNPRILKYKYLKMLYI